MKGIFLVLACALFSCLPGTAQVYDIVVAKDGTGDFRTLNAAIESVPENSARKTIFVKKGFYEEKVFIGNRWADANKVISLIGENPESVIISWSDYNGKQIPYPGKAGLITADGMTCPTFTVTSPDFYMENITVRNPATQSQAVALYQAGDRQTLKNCRITGNQDTHRLKKGRRFFIYRSTVEGGVDFIYAGGTAYFYHCTINSVKNGYITAPEDITYKATLLSGKTLRYGFFFSDCDITASSGVAPGSVYLGRPWGSECGSVFMKCRLGDHINGKGWMEWGGNETTACFAEYQSMNGDGTALADISQRASWSFQISAADVNNNMMLSHIYASVSKTIYDPVPLIIAPAPVSSVIRSGQELSWNAVEGARGYVVYADGSTLGFSVTGSFRDTVTRSAVPVYTVRTVGPHGNLSLDNGETDDVTEASVNAAINSPVTGISVPKGKVQIPVMQNGILFFAHPSDLEIYTLSGQKVLTCRQQKTCNINELPPGIYLIRATDSVNGSYSAKIRR